jgi:hypothetical protein
MEKKEAGDEPMGGVEKLVMMRRYDNLRREVRREEGERKIPGRRE